jgi:hypothetical protein
MKCHLIGYEGSNQYVLWDPARNEIVWARDLTIDEYQTQYIEEIQKFANDQVGILVSYDNRAFDKAALSQGEIYEDLPPIDLDRAVNYDSNEVLAPQETTDPTHIASDTTDINQLVDEVAGIDLVPQLTNSNETFEPENLTQIPVLRESYPKRNWNPSRKVRENRLYNLELLTLNTMTMDTIESQPIGKPIDPKDIFEAIRSPN